MRERLIRILGRQESAPISSITSQPLIEARRPETISLENHDRISQVYCIATVTSRSLFVLGIVTLIVGELLHMPELKNIATDISITGVVGTFVTSIPETLWD